MTDQFHGFVRPGGLGVRNHVAILSVVDACNPLAGRIAAAVPGSVALRPAPGRGQHGAERDQFERTLVGLGSHPNVAAVLVVGFDLATPKALAAAIEGHGGKAASLSVIEAGGTVGALAEGVRIAASMAEATSSARRQKVLPQDLVLGLKCGGSDPSTGLAANPVVGEVADRLVALGGTVILTETVDLIGAEELLAARAMSETVAAGMREAVERFERHCLTAGVTPTNLEPDHVAAGLSTPVEKSLGSIRNGGTSPVREMLHYAERPKARGLVFMDAIGGGIAEITGLAAAGAQLILFVTGTGHPTGNPIAPTLEISANPATVERHGDAIDVDLSPVFQGRHSVDEGADLLWRHILEVAAGRPTAGERLGDVEIAVAPVNLAASRQS